MARLIEQPTRIEAAGTPPKLIEEFIGRVNSSTDGVSIAKMTSPSGWSEPAQTPEFDEYTVVLRGTLHVKLKTGEFDVAAGQAIIIAGGEWVQYSTPGRRGRVHRGLHSGVLTGDRASGRVTFTGNTHAAGSLATANLDDRSNEIGDCITRDRFGIWNALCLRIGDCESQALFNFEHQFDRV